MPNKVDPLVGAHPLLVEAAPLILAEMAALQHPMMVLEGRRSALRQQQLYAQGRTKPGARVTNCDGIKDKSNHQVKDDGFHHALDFVFLVNGRISWEGPWDLFGAAAKRAGLSWGGDWPKPKTDCPHVEVPREKV